MRFDQQTEPTAFIQSKEQTKFKPLHERVLEDAYFGAKKQKAKGKE